MVLGHGAQFLAFFICGDTFILLVDFTAFVLYHHTTLLPSFFISSGTPRSPLNTVPALKFTPATLTFTLMSTIMTIPPSSQFVGASLLKYCRTDG